MGEDMKGGITVLLQVTMKLAERYNIELIREHVKTHQDDDCAYEGLSWKANLNCDCDHQTALMRKCP